MKATGTALWTSPNTGATNSSGFTGLPGGIRGSNGTFDVIGNFGVWWSSSEYGATDAWYRSLYYTSGYATSYYASKTYGFSVRCLRD
jgi:uncharacterized protein (TIGR02145 family)